jgi:hypothetical protein
VRAASTGPSLSILGLEPPQHLEAWVDVVIRMVVDALVEGQAAHDAQAWAIGSVEGSNRLGELDRLPNCLFEIKLVMVGETDRLFVVHRHDLDGLACLEVDRR